MADTEEGGMKECVVFIYGGKYMLMSSPMRGEELVEGGMNGVTARPNALMLWLATAVLLT